MLKGAAGIVQGDAPLGYELSGNAALFRGDSKLVRNLAPTGDGEWRLFNHKVDPGEPRDPAAPEPDRFQTMMAVSHTSSKATGGLDMPARYTDAQEMSLQNDKGA